MTLSVLRVHFASARPYNGGLPQARRAMVFDPGLWKQWEGQTVDGVFPLERCLGGTNRGAVFATQFQGQPAAIKLVPGSPESIAALLASWETAGTLPHPNLVQIFAGGETAMGEMRCAYLVTERADENLAEVLAERPLTTVEAREMLEPVLTALGYLHAKGFVHGNLKPSNILASGEQLKMSADSIVPRADAADDCRAIGLLLEQALGKVDRSSALPEPFGEIARNCLNPDPALRWDLARIETALRTDSAPVPSRSARKGWWGLLAAAAVVLGLVVVWPKGDGGSGSAATNVPSQAGPQVRDEASQQGDGGNAQSPTTGIAEKAAAEPSSKSPRTAKLSAAGDATAPEDITRVLPKIPQAALDTITGRVRINVRLQVDGAGKVMEATLEPPAASKYFTDRVLAAARDWKFPASAASSEWLLRFELAPEQIRVSPTKVASR